MMTTNNKQTSASSKARCLRKLAEDVEKIIMTNMSAHIDASANIDAILEQLDNYFVSPQTTVYRLDEDTDARR